MAEDIMITVSTDLGEALKNLQELEKQIKATQKSVDQQLNPSVNNTSTRMTGLGNKVSAAGNKIQSAIGTETALAFTALSAGVTSFTKSCVESAMNSQAEWRRFGSLVNSNGGNWSVEEKKVRDWAKTFSNEVGRSVADTREASMAFLQMGMSSKQLDSAMHATAGIAARAGITESEAASVVTSALLGKGRQLEKLTGLRIDDYKNAQGQIDKERLLNDIYNQNKGAIDDYANSTEGQIQKMKNSWASFKTSIGEALLPVVKIVADVVGVIVNGFANLPKPVKQVIAVFLLIVGAIAGVIGVLGILAPILINLGTLMTAVGSAGGVVAFLSSSIPILGGAIAFLAANLLPIIAIVLGVVAAFLLLYKVGKNLGWWNDLSGMISKFGEVLGQVGGAIMEFVSWFTKLFTDFPAAQKQFGEFIDGIGSYISSGLEYAAGIALTALRDLLLGLANGFVEGISKLGGDIYNGFASAGGYIWNGIEQLADFALPAIRNVLLSIAQGFVDGLSQFGTEIYNGFVNAWSYVSTAGNELLGTIGEMFSSAMTGAINYAMDFIGNVAQTFSEFPARIVESMGDIGGTILSNIANSMVNVRNGVGEILYGIVDSLSGLSDVPVVGILFDGMANSVRLAADMFSIFSSAAIGVVNVFAGLLTGTMSVDDALGSLGEIFGTAFAEVQAVVGQFVSNIISNFAGIAGRILEGFLSIPARLGQFFMLAVQTIQTRLNQARAIAGMLVSMLVQAVVTRFNLLVARVRMVFMMVLQAIRTRLNQARAIAGQLAGMIRQVIVTRFNLIIARVRQIFQRIVSTIRQRLQNAVSAAKEKAREIYEGIKNKVAEIPQAVADEFGKIPDKIRSALDNAKNIAVTKISELVSAVKSALGIASPGFIQRMMAFEFNSIPGIISDSSVLAIREAGKMATGIVDTWQDNMTSLGMPGLSMSGADYSNLVRGQSVDLFGQQPMARSDTALLTSSMNVPRQPMGSGQGMIQNTTNNSDDHTTHIHVENISLDCNHLTKQESRRILYDALDGLYTGGI